MKLRLKQAVIPVFASIIMVSAIGGFYAYGVEIDQTQNEKSIKEVQPTQTPDTPRSINVNENSMLDTKVTKEVNATPVPTQPGQPSQNNQEGPTPTINPCKM